LTTTCKCALPWGYDRLDDGDLNPHVYKFPRQINRYNATKGLSARRRPFGAITAAQSYPKSAHRDEADGLDPNCQQNCLASRYNCLSKPSQRRTQPERGRTRRRLSESRRTYTQDSAGHKLPGQRQEAVHLTCKAGQSINALLQDLKSVYATEESLLVLARIFFLRTPM